MSPTVIDLHLKTLEVLDNQLGRIFKELGSFCNGGGSGYKLLVEQANTIITEVVRLSKNLETSRINNEEH